MKFTVELTPVPQKRPRFSKFSTYDPSKSDKQEFMNKLSTPDDFAVINDPIIIELEFLMPIPKSASKKAKADMVSGKTRHTKRPDCDNLAKLVLDAMNEKIFTDDSIITKLIISKRYSETPMTIITITKDDK